MLTLAQTVKAPQSALSIQVDTAIPPSFSILLGQILHRVNVCSFYAAFAIV